MMKTLVEMIIVGMMAGLLAGGNVEEATVIQEQTMQEQIMQEQGSTVDGIVEPESDEMLGGGDCVMMPNPFLDFETIEEAIKHVDFEVKLPSDIPEGYELIAIRVIENDLFELIYMNGDSELVYRQGKGSEDISGDYTVYNEMSNATVGAYEVTFSGNNSSVNLAVWKDNLCSYSVNVNIGGEGVGVDVFTGMINSIQ